MGHINENDFHNSTGANVSVLLPYQLYDVCRCYVSTLSLSFSLILSVLLFVSTVCFGKFAVRMSAVLCKILEHLPRCLKIIWTAYFDSCLRTLFPAYNTHNWTNRIFFLFSIQYEYYVHVCLFVRWNFHFHIHWDM